MRTKIIFRADANASIGYGHFTRTLALADMLKDDFDCVFVTQSPTEYQKSEVAKVCALIEVPATVAKFDLFLELLQGDEIVVLDNYFYDTEYQRKIKVKGCRLVCIDDRKGQRYYADVVINHVIGTQAEDIITLSPSKLLLGSDYALLRKDFITVMQHPSVYNPKNNQVLVAMGGTDYFNMTGKIARMLSEGTKYDINLLIGDSYKFEKDLSIAGNIYKNLSAKQLSNLIREQKFVVCPPSTLAYEVCAVRCPLIVGSFAENHVDVEKSFEQYHLATSCGELENLEKETFYDLIDQTLQSATQQIDNQSEAFDGRQSERFQSCFQELI